jgi:hypothetical protein
MLIARVALNEITPVYMELMEWFVTVSLSVSLHVRSRKHCSLVVYKEEIELSLTGYKTSVKFWCQCGREREIYHRLVGACSCSIASGRSALIELHVLWAQCQDSADSLIYKRAVPGNIAVAAA